MKDRVEISAQVMQETPKALLLNDGVTSKWVPRKLCKMKERHNSVYDIFDMPEWLAREKGFI